MSGIAGILHLDGAPIDPALLRSLTDSLAFRGPNAQQNWIGGHLGSGNMGSGSVGFAHTLLRTTPESAHEHQPCSLDGHTWIVADARIDARATLKEELRAALPAPAPAELSEATDAGLILLAYQAWGERCVEHLLGDFVFAIWDAPRRRLFCARDQFGVRPFFYAYLPSASTGGAGSAPVFIFSNTLNTIRRHPAVSSRLNDLAIADFLLFDGSQDPEATAFADIHRLPAAHTLICETGRGTVAQVLPARSAGEPEAFVPNSAPSMPLPAVGAFATHPALPSNAAPAVSIQRYWTLSVTTPIVFRRDQDYLDRFLELLDLAVADRVRGGSAAVLMSGGLDSPTVAASAQRVLTRRGIPSGVRAYTEVFDRLIPHDERHFAGLVAGALKIPIQYFPADDIEPFADARRGDCLSPEPEHFAWPDTGLAQLQAAAAHSPVVLSGFGADPGLSCRITVHFRELLKARRYGRAIADATRYLTTENRASRLYLRTRLRLLRKPKTAAPAYPAWLNEDLAQRLHLRERWQAETKVEYPQDAVRPEASYFTAQPFWQRLFESEDAAVTGVPIEMAHPFFDIRLLSFLLALPRLPWCSDKQILRDAGRGVLPHAVCVRRKSPLRADPMLPLLARPETEWVDHFQPAPELEPYVSRERIPPVAGEKHTWAAWIHMRPLSLSYWLTAQASFNPLADPEKPRGQQKARGQEQGQEQEHEQTPAQKQEAAQNAPRTAAART